MERDRREDAEQAPEDPQVPADEPEREPRGGRPQERVERAVKPPPETR